MTNEQILKKAIEKVVKNGWNYGFKEWDIKISRQVDIDSFIDQTHSWSYIFSHSFAKAFWEEGRNRKRYNLNETIENYAIEGHAEYFCQPWQYHLQQMVLEKDPIKYLEQFI